jgi:FkbM family methyltransferase
VRRTRALSKFPRPLIDYAVSQEPTLRRGTSYGGWRFSLLAGLRGGLLVSASAGEDISFDVAIASEFGANVVLIDPTPRAVAHVTAALQRTGLAPESDFVGGGRQDPLAYDLTAVTPGQIRLEPYALWNRDSVVSFHAPVDPSHVSHTISDWRGAGTQARSEVEARRLQTLLGPEERARINILKLDIEGAEIEVLSDILHSGMRPEQILVEFDQLSRPTPEHRARVRQSLRLLRSVGYRLAAREGLNFTFLHQMTGEGGDA